MLLFGPPLEIALAIGSAVVGCVGLAAASVGFLLPPVPWSFRMALAGECLVMIQGLLTYVMGLAVMLVVLGSQIYRIKVRKYEF